MNCETGESRDLLVGACRSQLLAASACAFDLLADRLLNCNEQQIISLNALLPVVDLGKRLQRLTMAPPRGKGEERKRALVGVVEC